MTADVVAPDPRPRAVLLDLANQQQYVVPPEVALPYGGERVPALKSRGLLVEAEMHESRMVEDLDRIADEIGADAVVLRRGNHAVVVLEPDVVRCREVQFRNHFETHSAQAVEFGPQLLRRPAALDRQLRMARIDHALAEIEDDHVDAAGFHRRHDQVPPESLVEAQVVRRLIRRAHTLGGLRRLHPAERTRRPLDIAPEVHSEVNET